MAVEAFQQALTILLADPGVSALVADRIVPLLRLQEMGLPSVTLRRIVLTPTNSISGDEGLDNTRLQIDSLDDNYDGARQVADAVRAAMKAAGIQLINEIDVDSSLLPVGVANQIIQEFEVWS